ncbi:MAG: DUF4382 domain-containing protein [Gemmatimonadetes bacterium]|nr:DUF4382 domain-containing protein [Gemmatimonadota bacterium]
MKSRVRTLCVALLLPALVGACNDSLAPGEMATVEIRLRQTVAPPSEPGAVDTSLAVDRNAVARLNVVVSEVEFLPADQVGNEADPAAWVPIGLTIPVMVDLAGLPTEDLSSLLLTSGDVEAGSYSNVRLLVSGSTITFGAEVDLGVLFTFEVDSTYTVDIPAGDSTGILTNLAVTIDKTSQAINLLFDADATFLDVTATDSGVVNLLPVIR